MLVEVVSLHAGPFEAELALATAGAIGPGEVAGLAHHLSLGLPSAPQLGAVLHVRTGLGAHAKGQLALLAQGVAGTGQILGQGDGLAGLVQEAVTCREPRAFVRMSWEDEVWLAQGNRNALMSEPSSEGHTHLRYRGRRSEHLHQGRQQSLLRGGLTALPPSWLTVPAVQEVSDDGSTAG